MQQAGEGCRGRGDGSPLQAPGSPTSQKESEAARGPIKSQMGSELQPLPPRNCKSLHFTSRCRIKISGLSAAMTDLSQLSANASDPTPLGVHVCFCFCFVVWLFFFFSSIQDKDCHPRDRGRERLKTYLKSNRLPVEKKATFFTYPVCGKNREKPLQGKRTNTVVRFCL